MVTLEDWETTDLATDYRGDLSEWQIQSAITAEGANAIQGLHGGASGSGMIFSDGKSPVIEHDKTYRVYVNAQSNAWPGVAWFCSPTSSSEGSWDGYLLQMGEPDQSDLRLWRHDGGTYVSLKTIPTGTVSGTWYILELTHNSNNVIEFAQLDINGNDIGRSTYDASTDATIYSSGDFGFYWHNDSGTSPGTTYIDTLYEVTHIAGTVTLGGVPQSGVTVYIIDSATDTVVAEVVTDANGEFSYLPSATGPFHVATAYDSGTTQYNAESYPNIQ